MTVHMFRCYIGGGPMSITDLETAINDWIASNAEWTEDTQSHQLSEQNTQLNGTGTTYHMVSVRFLLENSKSNLLQKFQDKLKTKVNWYRVGYHSCTHDENDPTPCNWDDAVEWTAEDVTIPTGVPSFEVVA